MIELAHNFGSKATAVGIETREDAQALAGWGCDNGQGYLFAKPMTEKELMDMVMAARTGSKGAVQPPKQDAGVAKRPG
jgi:EAL domain-containing protein (putative c-di-GMP-specific phosphodiesterase class I)